MTNPEKRVRCKGCESMIRIVDAKYQNGRCSSCNCIFENDKREAIKNELRKNPPTSQEEIERLSPDRQDSNYMWIKLFLGSIRPPQVDPLKSSPEDFIHALRLAHSKYADDPTKFTIEFHHLCQPFENTGRTPIEGVMKIPEPHCSIFAVFMAHGNIGLGSFDQALGNIPRELDGEIERGLKILGCNSACGLIEKGRKSLRFRFNRCLPDELDEQLTESFLDALQEYNFVEAILIPFLKRELGGFMRWI